MAGAAGAAAGRLCKPTAMARVKIADMMLRERKVVALAKLHPRAQPCASDALASGPTPSSRRAPSTGLAAHAFSPQSRRATHSIGQGYAGSPSHSHPAQEGDAIQRLDRRKEKDANGGHDDEGDCTCAMLRNGVERNTDTEHAGGRDADHVDPVDGAENLAADGAEHDVATVGDGMHLRECAMDGGATGWSDVSDWRGGEEAGMAQARTEEEREGRGAALVVDKGV